MRSLRCCLLAFVLLAIAAPAFAFVPQTVTFTGHVSDFDPGNQLADDQNDTAPGCTPAALPLDIGRVYVTNDNNYLYLGIEFAQTCFCNMNLGLAINTTGTSGGGTTDPFGRKIGWANISTKPNWIIYDVTPTSCNTFNYEILYKDSLGTWLNKSTLVNPSWGSGSNGLGIIDSVAFKEIRLPLSVLNVSTGNAMHFEVWVTQEGTTKGPLDAMCSNDVQMSHPGSTTWDTTAVVQMTCMLPFTVLNAVDTAPPTVITASAVNFPLLGNKNFVLSTNKVDVTFSEPVDLTTAQTTGSYAFSGPVSRSITSAIRDASALNVVHLTLNSAVSANAAFYTITVTGVKDIAGNTIVANGSTNVSSFFVQTVKFTGDMHLPLCSGAFAPTDTFTVEGSLPPLTISPLCDNAFLVSNGDSTYSVTVPFAMVKDPVSGKATAALEWKLVHQCKDYEGISGNRTYTLSSDNGASVNLNVAWSDNDPANFLTHDVDVIFKVDASRKSPTGTDVITLLGDQLPLTFTQPGVGMLDNGVSPDAVAGDKIYTAKVRFKKCTYKTVGWKVDFNGAFECPDQGNRSFTINEALADTVGGPHGPLALPARSIDRCDVTDKAVAVEFRVDMFPAGPPALGDTVVVNGDYAPLAFAWPPAALYAGQLRDNGVAPDAKAGDYIYTRLVTFPDSTKLNMTYKYVRNGTYECNLIPNRALFLDDTQYSVASPLILALDRWDYCSTLGVPDLGPGPVRPGSSADFATLLQSFPNPGFARSTIRFELKKAGRVTLTVYDIAGRRVARLMEGAMEPGVHETTWNGLDASGRRVQAGLYLYELAMGGERLTRRLILSK